MEARELRIGNLILYKGDVIPATMIGQYGIQSNTDEIIVNAKFETGDLEPIPLTEEWLMKFGFERNKHKSLTKSLIHAWTNLYFNTEYFEISISGHSCPVKIQYVHQLQNLYFALTGQELELTDNKTRL